MALWLSPFPLFLFPSIIIQGSLSICHLESEYWPSSPLLSFLPSYLRRPHPDVRVLVFLYSYFSCPPCPFHHLKLLCWTLKLSSLTITSQSLISCALLLLLSYPLSPLGPWILVVLCSLTCCLEPSHPYSLSLSWFCLTLYKFWTPWLSFNKGLICTHFSVLLLCSFVFFLCWSLSPQPWRKIAIHFFFSILPQDWLSEDDRLAMFIFKHVLR